ncbi:MULTISPECIES: signal recognition particle-docking protein FtsY [unclassified Thioalkalivibrio]|uniref:signal recognition particle-docking protein FtsY n=1 Tax=unclassified Thioalkalivibrio TaxID=2621013 RepID=UPI00037CB304|nr:MULTISPECIES: signal recognition particle-docking protein FtsY [unclassified Thioalkalivibrio]
MFGFRKKKSEESTAPSPETTPEAPPETAADGQPARGGGWFQRLRQGLAKTGQALGGDLKSLFRRKIDDELFEELEERLLLADVGLDATQRIMDRITREVKRRELDNADALMDALETAMVEILEPVSRPLEIPQAERPFSILVVGINGAGKTTTIGKLAHRFQAEGRSVLLAAGDTFRAAAVEQLQTWGERNDVPVIAQGTGADSASVVYDGLQAAQARKTDILIADTAGRLHTQTNLMDEVRKVKRVMGRLDENAPDEVLLVVDGGTGQNALNQARQFHEALGLTGIVVTKLDGTAKGGVLFALAEQLGVPVRFIGVGEKAEDLQRFDARAFVRALLGKD